MVRGTQTQTSTESHSPTSGSPRKTAPGESPRRSGRPTEPSTLVAGRDSGFRESIWVPHGKKKKKHTAMPESVSSQRTRNWGTYFHKNHIVPDLRDWRVREIEPNHYQSLRGPLQRIEDLVFIQSQSSTDRPGAEVVGFSLESPNGDFKYYILDQQGQLQGSQLLGSVSPDAVFLHGRPLHGENHGREGELASQGPEEYQEAGDQHREIPPERRDPCETNLEIQRLGGENDQISRAQEEARGRNRQLEDSLRASQEENLTLREQLQKLQEYIHRGSQREDSSTAPTEDARYRTQRERHPRGAPSTGGGPWRRDHEDDGSGSSGTYGPTPPATGPRDSLEELIGLMKKQVVVAEQRQHQKEKGYTSLDRALRTRNNVKTTLSLAKVRLNHREGLDHVNSWAKEVEQCCPGAEMRLAMAHLTIESELLEHLQGAGTPEPSDWQGLKSQVMALVPRVETWEAKTLLLKDPMTVKDDIITYSTKKGRDYKLTCQMLNVNTLDTSLEEVLAETITGNMTPAGKGIFGPAIKKDHQRAIKELDEAFRNQAYRLDLFNPTDPQKPRLPNTRQVAFIDPAITPAPPNPQPDREDGGRREPIQPRSPPQGYPNPQPFPAGAGGGATHPGPSPALNTVAYPNRGGEPPRVPDAELSLPEKRRRALGFWRKWNCGRCRRTNMGGFYTCGDTQCRGEATDSQIPYDSWQCRNTLQQDQLCGQNTWRLDSYCYQCRRRNPRLPRSFGFNEPSGRAIAREDQTYWTNFARPLEATP